MNKKMQGFYPIFSTPPSHETYDVPRSCRLSLKSRNILSSSFRNMMIEAPWKGCPRNEVQKNVNAPNRVGPITEHTRQHCTRTCELSVHQCLTGSTHRWIIIDNNQCRRFREACQYTNFGTAVGTALHKGKWVTTVMQPLRKILPK